MSSVSFKIKQDNVAFWKQKVTVTSVPVATTKSLFGMRDGTFDRVVWGDFSLVLPILHVCARTHMRSLFFPDMNCITMIIVVDIYY